MSITRFFNKPNTLVTFAICVAIGTALIFIVGPELFELLFSEDQLVKQLGSKNEAQVFEALGKLRAMGKDAVPLLLKALNNDDFETRNNAIRALGVIGNDAEDAIEPLIQAIQHKKLGHRISAIRALGRLGCVKGNRAASVSF